MPSRIIREGILTSLAVDKLSSGAENFYRRILNVVDDFGRYHGTPALLRAAAYPLKIDKVQDGHITGWLEECVKAGLVETFTHEGLPYIEVLRFGTPRAKTSKFTRLQTDESRCKQVKAEESNGTVVVVESVVVSESETTLPADKPPNEVVYPADFQDFWQHYPKRKGKGAALKAWKKLGAADKQAAIDRAEWVAGCWEHNDPDEQRRQFIQDPATWLNARGWEDEDSAVELMARGR